jgi:hypothetical protein
VTTDLLPGISVCLIVRDEEALLPAALDSVRTIAAEILVGDTGSQDQTRVLAGGHGARVIDVPWTDDFAAARNAVLDQARHQWILFLDADHRLTAQSAAWLPGHLAGLPEVACAGLFRPVDGGPGHWRICLFRQDLGIRWQGRLHEMPVWPNGRPVETRLVPALTFDDASPLRPRDGEEAKHERYVAVLQQTPESPIGANFLATSLRALGRIDAHQQLLLDHWHDPGRRQAWPAGRLPLLLATGAREGWRWSEAAHWARQTLAEAPLCLAAWQIVTEAALAVFGPVASLPLAELWWQASQRGDAAVALERLRDPANPQEALRHLCGGLLAARKGEALQAMLDRVQVPADVAVLIDLDQDGPGPILDWLIGQAAPERAARLMALRAIGTAHLHRLLVIGHLESPYAALLADWGLGRLLAQKPDSRLWQALGELRLQRFGDRDGAIRAFGHALAYGSPEAPAWLAAALPDLGSPRPPSLWPAAAAPAHRYV